MAGAAPQAGEVREGMSMGWYEAAKDAWKALDKLKGAEGHHAMAEVLMEGAKLAEENAELRAENLVLRSAAANREAMVFDANAYWIEREGQREGPYCPRCQDGDSKAVRMLEGRGFWKCEVCKTVVRGPGRSNEQAEDFQPPREPIR
jgi:hypothetical protein